MNCEEFRNRLEALVEDHCSLNRADAALRQHADTCPHSACRLVWQEQQWLEDVLPRWRGTIPTVSLEEQVIAVLTHRSPDRSTPHAPVTPSAGAVSAAMVRTSGVPVAPSRVAMLVTVVALAVMLAVSLPLRDMSRTPPRRGGGLPVARSAPPSVNSINGDERSDVLGKYAAMPQVATEFLSDTVAVVLPVSLLESDEPEPPRVTAWRSRIEEKIRPLEEELGTAMDAIRELLAKPPMSST